MIMNYALQAITRIINEGAYCNIAINEVLQKNQLSDHEKRLFTHIVLGTVENKIRIDYYLAPLIKGKRIKPYLKNTLRMGVYMLDEMRLAPHYVVNALVQMIKKQDFKGSRLVNGVLRTYQQLPKPDLTKLPQKEYLHLKYSFPRDLLNLLMREYPDQVEAILAEMQKPTPNYYRINTLKIKPEEVAKILQTEKSEFQVLEDCLISQTSLINHALFEEGKIIAQNPSSIKVAKTVNPQPKEAVLDICCGLGTKSMHLAGLMDNQGEIVACDIYPHKLRMVEDSATKLNVKIIQTVLADATVYQFNRLFDHVLVDAPCSGLGVIAHKVDLKYQMTQEKINELIELQKRILENASLFVKCHGTLTYSTCTINKSENEEQIEYFLSNHPDFEKVYEELMMPGSAGDGFYICKMIRKDCM
ncbi:MAG: 16S rRNA (cytosine(967)-C(5))-methyltransferase RsmB [Bacilli bacterium]|jgi:16S rRNA (cytosine967-C5)-methyltransferase|nr:16S rRNA (cytosine(967)-C(5))-methyltransferase RsmB [Acholeplasmataceae bacterium]